MERRNYRDYPRGVDVACAACGIDHGWRPGAAVVWIDGAPMCSDPIACLLRWAFSPSETFRCEPVGVPATLEFSNAATAGAPMM